MAKASNLLSLQHPELVYVAIETSIKVHKHNTALTQVIIIYLK